MEHHLPYDQRKDYIPGNEFCHRNCEDMELCILAKDSHGSISSWFDTQCVLLPKNFEDIQEKYSVHSNQMYIIHSTRQKLRDQKKTYVHKLSSSSSNSLFKLNFLMIFSFKISMLKIVLL